MSKAEAATYYIDCNAAGDAGNGTSISTAWKTVAKVNGSTFQPGDSVLFNRGCTWRERLTIPSSGSAGNRIVFGAYGEGDNPMLNGSALLDNANFSPYSLTPTLYAITPNNDLATGGARNYRQVFTAAGNSNTVKIRLTAATSADWVIAGASIGQQSSGNATVSLTRITFGGNNGVTISAGQYADSDVISFPVVSGTNYLIHVYMTQRNMRNVLTSSYTVWYDGNSDETLTATPDGSQLNSTNASAFVTAVFGDMSTIWSTVTLPTYAVSSLTSNGTTATVTTSSPHELTTGQYVKISGASLVGYNGTFVISVNSPTTFTYTVSSGLNSPASGTIYYTMVSPIQVWENNKFLAKRSSLTAMGTPGGWYWDGTTLYVNGWYNDNPLTNGRTYEVAHLSYGIYDNWRNYLEIRNIDSIQTYGSSDVNGNYATSYISGIYLQGSNSVVHDLSVYNTWRHGFSFYAGSTNNLAYNLNIHDDLYTTPTSIYYSNTTGNTLQNSVIFNSQVLCVNDGLLVMHGGAHGNIVQNNDFYANVGNPLQLINSYDSGSDANIIRFNHIHGIFQHAISGTAVSNDLIYGNLIEAQNGSSSAIMFNTGSGVSIYNNTVISPTGQYGLSLINHPNSTIKNNVLYGTQSISADTGSLSGLISDYNLFYNSSGVAWKWGANIYNTFSNWQTNSNQDGHSTNLDPKFINVSNNLALQYFSPAIDSGTPISGIATDYLGNHIYGIPDIGAYEYQPPYTVGTDDINISSPVRIYADGKYRYTNTTSGSTNAKLSITPQAGFGTGDYSEWMDIAIDTWHTSSDYYKKWTEESSNHTLITNHTIGDLEPNTYYTLKIDTTDQNTYLSNSSGQITFAYSGGYSTHTFEITEDTISPASFTLVSPANNTVTSNRIPTFSWNASSDTESNLSKYQLYIDEVMDVNNIASSASSIFPSAELSCGNHFWYMKAIDNNNNTTNSNTFTLNINCAGGFISPTKPIVTPTDPTLGTVPTNITQIAISRTLDFTNTSWQPFDKDKFKNIDQTTETLYVKFRTDQGAVSDIIIYTPQASNQSTTITLNEGDIVKTLNSPDVYVIKYKNNKQYKRLILSPLVFKSYQHLKWENIKIISQEQLDKYTTSNLVKETIDTIIYLLFPNGDIGERKVQDTSINYDPDSVYEINVTDRDSYKLVK